MRARRAGNAADRQHRGVGREEAGRAAVGPAPLATAVSLPTARAARPRAAGTRPGLQFPLSGWPDPACGIILSPLTG